MADVAVETAPGDENDDNWLYGESVTELAEGEVPSTNDKEAEKQSQVDGTGDAEEKEQEDGNDDSHFNDEHFADVGREDQEPANGDADSQDNGDSDSDDSDDVKVTIGEIKSGPQAYASLNIKRGVGLVAAGASEKPRAGPTTGGKVTLDDLEGSGSINGVPALEFNIDTIEDKPWNKPGADISDYFNYGFNEVTWSAYCERQRRLRVNEAGVGLHVGPPTRPPPQDMRRPPGPMRSEENMPPPGNNYQARENTIQVMTAERREYGRGGHVRDAPPVPDYFGAPPPDHYYPPTYSHSWAPPEQTGWAPSDIKELTPGPMAPMGPPPGPAPMTHLPPHMGSPYPPYRPPSHHERERDRDRERDRERLREREDRDRRERERRDEVRQNTQEERDRDRERERSRSIKPDRIREKSYRRERSRSRSRRHKSRSRSPAPRERRGRSRDMERPTKTKTKEKDDDK